MNEQAKPGSPGPMGQGANHRSQFVCPNCGAIMVIREEGPLGDVWAFCEHCQTRMNVRHLMPREPRLRRLGPLAAPPQAEPLAEAAPQPDPELLESLRGSGLDLRLEEGKWTIVRDSKAASREDLGLLSPEEIVAKALRLAAADESVLPPEQRKRCPSCNAVAAVKQETCQWCGEPLTWD